jgi:hypothetical protein
MKKALPIIAILAIIAICLHYVAWHYIADKAVANFEKVMRNDFQGALKYYSGEFTYKIKKVGYPAEIGIEIVDLNVSIEDMNISVVSANDKGISVLVPFSLDPNTFHIDASGSHVIKFALPEGNGSVNLSIGQDFTTTTTYPDNFNDYAINGLTKDIVIDMSMNILEEAKVGIKLNIKELKVNGHKTTANNKVNSHIDLALSGGSVSVDIPGEENIKLNLDSYIVQGGFKNMPAGIVSSDDILMKLREDVMQAQENKTPLDLVEVKKQLKDFIHKMAELKSVIYLDKLAYKFSGLPKVDTIGINMSTNISINDDYTPSGKASVEITDIDKLLKEVENPQPNSPIQIPPMALSFVKDGKVELSAEAKDGMLIFNGNPMFPLPPIDTLVDMIPDSVTPPADY